MLVQLAAQDIGQLTDIEARRVFARFGGFRMVPVMANGQAAFAAYTRGDDGSYHAHEVLVPAVTKTGIAHIVVFLNPELVRMFGLPHEYDPAAFGKDV